MRRFTTAERGPVPITPQMNPRLQAIACAGNEGVYEATSSEKRKRGVKGKRFQWDDEDRFRLGKMAHEGSNKAALKKAKRIHDSQLQKSLRRRN